MKRIPLLIFISLLHISLAEAQTLRDYVRRGNRLMEDTINGKDLSDKAIVQYQKALDLDSTFAIAHYNMGNALLRQGKAQEALQEYQKAGKYETDKQNISDIYHNMGVLMHLSKKYAEAVECYRNSLRHDPSNDETRYNYVLALWHLKNQNDQDQENKDNQDQKDQNQKEQDKDKQQDKQGQDKKQQENQDQQQEEEQQQQQQSQPQDAMSKENAERLLNAAMRNEKETQEKIQRKQQDKLRPRRLQKQW